MCIYAALKVAIALSMRYNVQNGQPKQSINIAKYKIDPLPPTFPSDHHRSS